MSFVDLGREAHTGNVDKQAVHEDLDRARDTFRQLLDGTAAEHGLLTAPVMLTAAIAPWAGSALAAWLGGYPAVFVVLGAIGALAAALSTASVPRLSSRLTS